jgi:hypothetical protein
MLLGWEKQELIPEFWLGNQLEETDRLVETWIRDKRAITPSFQQIPLLLLLFMSMEWDYVSELRLPAGQVICEYRKLW